MAQHTGILTSSSAMVLVAPPAALDFLAVAAALFLGSAASTPLGSLLLSSPACNTHSRHVILCSSRLASCMHSSRECHAEHSAGTSLQCERSMRKGIQLTTVLRVALTMRTDRGLDDALLTAGLARTAAVTSGLAGLAGSCSPVSYSAPSGSAASGCAVS